MRNRHGLAVLAGVVFAGATMAQAPLVPLRWEAEKGKSLAYDLAVSTTVRQEQGDGAARSMELRQNARVTLTVEEKGEDGSAAMTGDISSVLLVWKDGDVEALWEGGGPEASSEAGRALAAVGRGASKAAMRVTIDARGMITGISGFDAAQGALEGQNALDEAALGVFEPVSMASRLAPVFQGDAAGAGAQLVGAGARRVGSGWQTTERVGLGSAGALEITTDWVLKEVADGVAMIEGVSRVEALRPEEPSPGAPEVRVERASGVTKRAWDMTAGALKSCETEQTLTMVWRLGDLTLRQEQRSTSSVRRAE